MFRQQHQGTEGAILRPEMRSRLARLANVFWGQVVVALSSLAAIRVYTELLGTAEFGVAMLAMGGVALFDSLSVMALNQTLMSRCGAVGDIEHRRQVSIGLCWTFLKWAAPASGLIGLVAGVILVLFGHGSQWLFLPILMCTLVATETAKISLLCLFVLDRHYGRYSIWLGGESLLTLIGTSAALIFWQADAISLLAGNALSRLVCTTLCLSIFAPKHLQGIHLTRVQNEIRPALEYGIPVAMMGPLGWISTYLDRYILGGLLGTATTGIYAAITGLVSRPYALATSVFSNYFRPLYFDPSLVNDGVDGCLRILRNWLMTAFGIGLTGCLALAVLGDWIASIMLAPEFRNGASLLMVLFALSQTFSISIHAADNAILALRGSQQLLKAQVILSFATLVLIPIGISFDGVIGGLIGRCIAEAIKLVVVLLLATTMIRRKNGMSGVLGKNLEDPPL